MIFFFENDIITLKNNLVTLSELNLKDINKLFNSITDHEIFFLISQELKKIQKKFFIIIIFLMIIIYLNFNNI